MRTILILLAFISWLSGCQSQQQDVWTHNLEVLPDAHPVSISNFSPEYKQVDMVSLPLSLRVAGYKHVGTCSFYDELLSAVPGSSESSLRKAAKICGADLVLWAMQSQGTQARQGWRATSVPGSANQPTSFSVTTRDPYGGVSRSVGTIRPANDVASSFQRGVEIGSSGERYTYNTEVFEYRALFFKKITSEK